MFICIFGLHDLFEGLYDTKLHWNLGSNSDQWKKHSFVEWKHSFFLDGFAEGMDKSLIVLVRFGDDFYLDVFEGKHTYDLAPAVEASTKKVLEYIYCWCHYLILWKFLNLQNFNWTHLHLSEYINQRGKKGLKYIQPQIKENIMKNHALEKTVWSGITRYYQGFISFLKCLPTFLLEFFSLISGRGGRGGFLFFSSLKRVAFAVDRCSIVRLSSTDLHLIFLRGDCLSWAFIGNLLETIKLYSWAESSGLIFFILVILPRLPICPIFLCSWMIEVEKSPSEALEF